MVFVELLDDAKGTVTEILRPRNMQPPPRTPQQVVTETGIGFVSGLITGYICKKLGALAFSTVGGGITCISSKST